MLLKTHEIAAYHEFVLFNKNLLATDAAKTAWLLLAYSVPFVAIQHDGQFLDVAALDAVIRAAKVAPNAPVSIYNDFQQHIS